MARPTRGRTRPRPDPDARALECLDAAASGSPRRTRAPSSRVERTTNHDVKAVEYFLRERLARWPLMAEFTHFACTSEDVNNLAWATLVRDARSTVVLPAIDSLAASLRTLAHRHADAPMLARTHGSSCVPDHHGKGDRERGRPPGSASASRLAGQPILAKMNGATGNYNATRRRTRSSTGRTSRCASSRGWDSTGIPTPPRSSRTTGWRSCSDRIARLNTVLVDFSRDVWGYISLGYFRSRADTAEVGSSTMPHKVNPIDFENAEGNLGLANALLDHPRPEAAGIAVAARSDRFHRTAQPGRQSSATA